ncbi:unnamed protein product [Cochlearia groenlandica]
MFQPNMNINTNTSENNNNQEEMLGNNHQDSRLSKRKRYHRHTEHQIHEMEAYFKECPHPDEKQRKELSLQLGLDHLQVKFWFQNKRTQNKNQQERHENSQLRMENEKLRSDNNRVREALAKGLCPKCDGRTAIGEMSFEEHHLRLENARLQEEIDRISALEGKSMGKPVLSHPLMSSPVYPRPFDFGLGDIERDVYENRGHFSRLMIIGLTEANKQMIIELAVEAMEELMTMAQVGEPLWNKEVNGTKLALNLDEYTSTFRSGLGPTLTGFRTEASKETGLVVMNHMSIVEKLMDASKWSTMFASMVARAITLDVLSTGLPGNFNGALHLITSELQVLSPLVSTREVAFARYCKQQGDGLWAVVDVSIDHLIPNLELKCRRRPSGCLIQEIPNGFSKVTWVEHAEVDDRGKVHNLFKPLVITGQALGANRWLATLDRQCERLASLKATHVPSVELDGLLTITNHGKWSILKLAERMARTFLSGVTSSNGDMWSSLSGYTDDDIRVMTRKSLDDPGQPHGLVLCAATSFWVSVPPKTVFDFLRDESNRTKWDVMFNGGSVQKMSQVANGRDSRNCVSLLRCANTNHNKMMMIQETSTDPTASFVIYAPVDVSEIENVLSGGAPDYGAILPSGFAILSDGMANHGREGGSLVSVAFQVLVESGHSAKLTFSSVATVENLILETVQKIKTFFHCQAV